MLHDENYYTLNGRNESLITETHDAMVSSATGELRSGLRRYDLMLRIMMLIVGYAGSACLIE